MHDFSVAGTYTIRLRGSFPRIYFNYNFGSDLEKIINIDQWSSNAWTNMASAFAGCNKINITASDTPNLTNVSDLSSMFSGCTLLNPIGLGIRCI